MNTPKIPLSEVFTEALSYLRTSYTPWDPANPDPSPEDRASGSRCTGCCSAIFAASFAVTENRRSGTELYWNAEQFFNNLFCIPGWEDCYWWFKEDRTSRIIALQLAALIAEEENR